ncbi:MAG: 3-phosphoshikimate 1-carboxyvinyltransferase [Dehalococcoidales bacterium]|nr:3-phosphoshikimate 1-carboxyvinyltransferase [Dehalococcoidales bacterium]MDP7110091.1 3-phosphoshikimate 1-carboxyvinyltransferase [Dehalococcoidales bacterium]MDP7309629.1 3-phosphoshikimate 1-carboxyvinyltransferase [Dehalococcoidales bacterium]MDP7409438.1 3-phosphoshikimate 1-carboxyvinyltransferase [Dehalococcoidales bacterium]MDP7675773.1 3-phosphoshikimate 1-carboxyvinyltransferase [Dehalococcoidales bacterium]
MRASISRSGISGRVIAPSSKSYTIRGLLCAALATGESEIIHPLGSDDTEASLDVLSKIGVSVYQQKDSWQINGGNLHKPKEDLFCRNSALTLRFMTAITSIIPGQCRLTAGPSLMRRPIEPLIQALQQLGVDCHYQASPAGVIVNGNKLSGGMTSLSGSISSQFISALLLISPFTDEGMTIRIATPLESQSFVLMTLECLKLFGIKVKASVDLREFEICRQTYQPTKYTVESDWSSASYLLALGALVDEVVVENLNLESLQGDKTIIDHLRDMGASVTVDQTSIRVRKSRLKAIKTNLTDCIDLLPTLSVLASIAEGESQFTGVARARLKESNRIVAIREGLERMGIEVVEEEDKLSITGASPKGATIDPKNDHRIAMAFGLLGSLVGGTIIEQAECVDKTYPEFWTTLKSIGGRVKLDEQ